MNYVKFSAPGVLEVYPYDTWQLRQDNPSISFPQFGMDVMSAAELDYYNVSQVVPTDPPVFNPETEYLLEGCEYANGVWVQTWTVVQHDPVVRL